MLKSGRITICLKPGFAGSGAMPATHSYAQGMRSPSIITWLPEFIDGLAVLPFHSSQMVVAPFSTI